MSDDPRPTKPTPSDGDAAPPDGPPTPRLTWRPLPPGAETDESGLPERRRGANHEANRFDPRDLDPNLLRRLPLNPNANRPPMRSGSRRTAMRQYSETPTLDQLGRDLTALARAGQLRDAIGRDELILDVARGLLRKDKPNPLLIGDPGVGKTAIVEGLAVRLAQQELDPRLSGLRIVEVPVSSLVAGTFLRGSLEARVTDLLDEIRGRRDIVLFIDEIHQVLGAGATQHSDLDVAEMLKPALARGEIRCIGATTPADAEPLLRSDKAIARRFLPMLVQEMSPESALDLLRGVAPVYEAHHGVTLTQDSLAAAVSLSVRYLLDRRLPDKALDLLDDACTRVALPTLQQAPGGERIVRPTDIAAVLRSRYGITVPDHALNPQDTLTSPPSVPADLAERLEARIIGQPEAIAAVTDAVRVASLGLRGGDRPRAVLLFGGPTGVGKTALARALAEALFDNERALLRLDLSEFGGRHDAARLVGAPPGYIGYDDGGQLARFLRQHPESVVLLDEIEKAHPDVLDLFLQVFDAGRVTDAQGQLADARHAYFILTTNVPLTDDLAALRRRLRPEFLNRIDRIVPFRPLELGDLERIAQARLETIASDLRGRGVHLHADQDALACLARPETDGRPANGRTIERRLDQEVVAPVAELVTLLGGSPAAMPLILRLVPGTGGCRVVPQGLGGIAGGVA